MLCTHTLLIEVGRNAELQPIWKDSRALPGLILVPPKRGYSNQIHLLFIGAQPINENSIRMYVCTASGKNAVTYYIRVPAPLFRPASLQISNKVPVPQKSPSLTPRAAALLFAPRLL